MLDKKINDWLEEMKRGVLWITLHVKNFPHNLEGSNVHRVLREF